MEISELRTYNSKTFTTPRTKERLVFDGRSIKQEWSGELRKEFHVKPIHYIAYDGTWRDLSEIASYFGNRNGMVLKQGWESKVDFEYTLWYIKRQRLIRGKGIRTGIDQGKIFKPLELDLVLNATGTFYPDPNPETTSVDGVVFEDANISPVDWATLITAAGNGFDDLNTPSTDVELLTGSDANLWNILQRGIILFDTSSLGASASISAATLSVFGAGKVDTVGWIPDINIYGSTPASNTALANGDFTQTQNTAFSTAITYDNFSTSGYNAFALNASGISNISKTGVSKFSAKNANYDVAQVEPTWSENGIAYLQIHAAEVAGTSQDPKLVVTYTAASGSIFIPRMTLVGVG